MDGLTDSLYAFFMAGRWPGSNLVGIGLWVLTFVGHVGIWCVTFNRIHATALPRRFRKQTEKIIIPIIALPIVYVIFKILVGAGWEFAADWTIVKIYMTIAAGLGVFFAAGWFHRRFLAGQPDAITDRRQVWLDIRSRVTEPFFHGLLPKLLGRVPGNLASKLTLEQLTWQLNMPAALEGLKICQLSDLHFTGHISIEYFEQVVAEANRFDPDLIFVTGDFIDEAECLPWLDSTVGRLRAKYGVFYVLGNHDQRLRDEDLLRSRLAACGLTMVEGSWQTVEINGCTIAITGTALPWFRAADDLPGPDQQPPATLRILLSHSPDQIDWASKSGYEFDLMFAGHTHGGQISLPIVGPIVAPSKYGVKYCAGTFQIGSILMHVSRGISGDEPIRINCPPELGQFTLVQKT